MKLRNLAFATAAASLAFAPVAAQAAQADRASQPVVSESNFAGGDFGRAAIIVALAAIGMGVLLLTDDDNNDNPISA